MSTVTTDDPTLTYPVVTTERFPHGVLCADCRREILPGQPFTDRLVGMVNDDDTSTDLTCVYCDHKGDE